jgi:hypothetical protein
MAATKQVKSKKPVEPIDFKKLKRDLQTLMQEVDLRLASEFDAFSPFMWNRLRNTINAVILEISAVRMVINGKTCAAVAAMLGLKKQQVAAFMAYNTMWQDDYADPTTINNNVDCPSCRAGLGNRCVSASGRDARVHDSRRQAYRDNLNERALNMKAIRKATSVTPINRVA